MTKNDEKRKSRLVVMGRERGEGDGLSTGAGHVAATVVPKVSRVGRPILVEGAAYKVDPSGQPEKNQFSNSAGYFRIVESEEETKKAGLTAAQRVSTVFPCERVET